MSEFEDVCTDIRSILNSSKDQITVSSLNKDYQVIIGSTIPFRKLGYQTLEDLLRAVPNVRLNRVGNDVFIDLRPDEKIAHIAKLVQGQAAAKKKGKKRYGRPFAPRRSAPPTSGYNSYSNNRGQSSRTYHDRDFDENNKDDPKYWQSKFRSTVRTVYDFSDDDEDNELTGFEEEGESSDEMVSFTTKIKADEEKVPSKEFKNMSVTVGNSSLRAGRGNFVSRGAASVSKRLLAESGLRNKQSDDVGYGISKLASGSTRNVRDVKISPNQSNLLFNKTSPASILATGRAAKKELPNQQKNYFASDNANGSLPTNVFKNTFEDALAPFKPVNTRIVSNNIMSQMSVGSKNSFTASPSMNRPGLNEMHSNSTSPRSPKSDSPFSTKPQKMIGMFQSGPDIQPSYGPDTLCQKLYAFTVKHGLSLPVFTNFHKFIQKTRSTLYISKVKINDAQFSCLPFEDSDLSVVQENTAQIALEELTKRYEGIDSGAFGTTTEKQKIIARITEIVSNHPTGLKSETVEQKFREIFHEKLPTDWLEIIKSFSLLSVEKLIGGIFVYPPQDIQGSLQNVNKLPPLILPEEDEWSILITTCSSTTCVYFRIIGQEYSEKFDALDQIMNDTYKTKKDEGQSHPVEIIREGNYYVAYLDKVWYRVKVLSPDLGNKYRVSLVDHGDTDEVIRESIYQLQEEFTHLPAQAIRCGLTGLEQFHNNEYVTHTLNSMTIALNSMTEPSVITTGFVARVDSRNPHLMITIYDTKTELDININEALKEKIEKELTPPSIPPPSSLVKVYLTRVREDGGAYVQIVSDGLKRLMSSMVEIKHEMMKYGPKYRIGSVTNLIGEKMVLAKYHGDKMWHRAVVNSLLNGNKTAQVHFIDYGNTEIVPIEDLAEMKHFAYVLKSIPPQAVEVQIMRSTGELFTQSVIEFLMSVAQPTNDDDAPSRLFLMKVVNSAPVPDVEFFLRDDNNQLQRLNDIVGSFYSQYRGTDFQDVTPNFASSLSSNKLKPATADDVSKSFTVIPPFPVPDSGKTFRVYISMIVNPGHFVVQPLDYRGKLAIMSNEMRRYYTKEKPKIDFQQIKVGNVFAIENDQKIWCRGRIIGILKELSSVSFKCLDYMDIVTVHFKNIHPLMPCFRKLPALAIKAELAGIAPMHSDWDMSDCLRFHELLMKKEFTSVIVEKSEDIVSMMLFDTSVHPERDIGALLVEEERAIDVTE